MNSVRKLQPSFPPKPSRKDVDETAKAIVAKNKKKLLVLTPEAGDIVEKVRKKWVHQTSYYKKNKKWRNLALVTSWICFIISLAGALFGIGSFLEPNSFISWLLAFVAGSIALANEIAFRYFTDKYYDLQFLFMQAFNQYLPKFLLCSLLTIIVSSGGIYKYYMKHHAPDPTLVAAKADLIQLEKQLATAQIAHEKFADRNTIKSGKWKGEVKDNMKPAVKKSKQKVEAIETEVLNLRKKTAGKKSLDPNYQLQVFYDSLMYAFILALFAGLYIFCMRYMAYFDAEHYKEAHPKEYLEMLAANNNQTINFT